MKIAFQMDPIETIDIKGDTTFALMLEAQSRGYEIYTYHPDSLALEDGILRAKLSQTRIRDEIGNHFIKSPSNWQDLSQMDVILLRQDPPFDMHYITSTHLLDHIHPKTLVVNDPIHVRNSPEKLLITHFEGLMPPTLITKDIDAIKLFREKHEDIIIKPLYGNGGAGVFRLQKDDQNLSSLHELFSLQWREPFMVQAYLPDVIAGDKRIILIDGDPVGVINRRPQKGEVRSNMHVGGQAEPSEITDHELELCQKISPYLKEHGLILVGVDIIGNYMTEINVTSPTGIREIKKFGGEDIAALFWEAVLKRKSL